MCEVAFQGGAGKQTNSTLAGSSPRETPTRSCQRQTASLLKRYGLRVHTYKRRRRRRKKRLRNGKGERRKTPIHFKVRPLAGVPYKLHALNINLKSWHSINYIRRCHNYQDQWAEGVNCYFCSCLNKGIPPNEQSWRMISHT